MDNIKIIAGKLKGKNLPVLDNDGLRPTTSRVRETVFAWLENYLANARVLDLFAGSGALGLEAYSRGAASVDFVELNQENSLNLKKLTSSIDNEKLKVFNEDALGFISYQKQKYDLIFIDPPYKLDIYKQVLSSIKNNNLIDNKSIIYVEMRDGSNQIVPGFEVIREQHAGQIKFALWRKTSFF